MFRIAFTVRDKALSEIMHYLNGKAYDLDVRPVGEKQKPRKTAGEWLAELKPTFRYREAREVIGPSVSTYLGRALQQKRIKKIKTGIYAKISGKG